MPLRSLGGLATAGETGLPDVIRGLMTFSALITYEGAFEALICEGCDHVSRLASVDINVNENFYSEANTFASEVAN